MGFSGYTHPETGIAEYHALPCKGGKITVIIASAVTKAKSAAVRTECRHDAKTFSTADELRITMYRLLNGKSALGEVGKAAYLVKRKLGIARNGYGNSLACAEAILKQPVRVNLDISGNICEHAVRSINERS